MTCEVLANLLAARCAACSLHVSEEVHVTGMDCMSAPLRMLCRDCCPIHRERQPTFEAVTESVEGELFG